MQKYIRLKLTQLHEAINRDREYEWDKAVNSHVGRGFEMPDDTMLYDIEKIGLRYLDKFIGEISPVIKTALLRE